MEELFFECTLETDIVLNSKLATEGNMTTLDYISGSNFLGILASSIYNELLSDEAMAYFHSEEVSFGDAVIAENGGESYQFPLSYFMEKLKMQIGTDLIKIHHEIDFETNKEQLKQVRTGFFNAAGKILPIIQKTFALKSAYDKTKRRSKDGAMFGFESLKKGQKFIFSVRLKDKTKSKIITDGFSGIKRIGKSKNAEFGQVTISAISNISKIGTIENPGFVLVYAQSNLCFFDEKYGQSTLKPTSEQLGVRSGEIIWGKSQIRTYSYSPWNYKRNTTNTQRDCIKKGSVFYIETNNSGANYNSTIPVGEYIAEGLGRVIYNPLFLKATVLGNLDFSLTKLVEKEKPEKTIEPKTALGQFLKSQKDKKEKEFQLINSIQAALINNKNQFSAVSASQWGGIRAIATKCIDKVDLENKLFGENGFLTKGVAADKYWNKNNGALREKLKTILKDNNFSKEFTIKFASEMAKEKEPNNGE